MRERLRERAKINYHVFNKFWELDVWNLFVYHKLHSFHQNTSCWHIFVVCTFSAFVSSSLTDVVCCLSSVTVCPCWYAMLITLVMSDQCRSLKVGWAILTKNVWSLGGSAVFAEHGTGFWVSSQPRELNFRLLLELQIWYRKRQSSLFWINNRLVLVVAFCSSNTKWQSWSSANLSHGDHASRNRTESSGGEVTLVTLTAPASWRQ